MYLPVPSGRIYSSITLEAAVEGVTPATGALKPLPEDAPAALKRVYKDFQSNDGTYHSTIIALVLR